MGTGLISQRGISALALALGTSLLATSANAQSFNIDFDTSVAAAAGDGAPAATFGAAANSPGTWNLMQGAVQTAFPNILGLSGAPTGVSFARSTAAGGDFAFNNLATTGNHELLLDDGHDLSAPGPAVTYTFTGLSPGPYQVYTYAVAPDTGADITIVTVTGASAPNPQNSGGPIPPNAFAQGITHTLHNVVVSANGQLSIIADGASTLDFGTVNGIQLVFVPEPASFGALAAGGLVLMRRRRR